MPHSFTVADRKLFLDLLTRRSGLRVPKSDLEHFDSILLQRMRARGCKTLIEYYNLLETGRAGADEFKELAKLFTVGETYFFRSSSQFKALRLFILPSIIEARRKAAGAQTTSPLAADKSTLSINIWSAGCATGEEPYSIAITLKEVLPAHEYWNVKIAGTDINEDALEIAGKAVYTSHSLRGVRKPSIEAYFKPADGRFRLVDSIRKMVTFSYANLAEPYFPSPFGPDVPADLILCRNVLMYFEPAIADEILSRFYEILHPGAFLVLGTAEAVSDENIGLEEVTWQDAYFYRKPLLAPPPPEEKTTSIFSLTEYIPGARTPLPVEPGTETRETTSLRGAFRWLKVALENNPNDPVAHFQLAKLYANRGRFQMALQECEQALEIDALFALPYLLLGIIHYRSGEIEMAIENLRRALYNDKNLVLAHFYLAEAFKTSGETKRALREFKAAAIDLQAKPPKEIVYQSDSFTSEALLKVVRGEIASLEKDLQARG